MRNLLAVYIHWLDDEAEHDIELQNCNDRIILEQAKSNLELMGVEGLTLKHTVQEFKIKVLISTSNFK